MKNIPVHESFINLKLRIIATGSMFIGEHRFIQTCLTLFCLYKNNTVGTICPITGGCSWPLEDLNVFNIIGIKIKQRGNSLSPGKAITNLRISYPDSI